MIKKWLEKAPVSVLALYASFVIFVLYTCSYGYRKPFSAGIYENEVIWGFDAKLLFVLFQIIGYALSKFIGIPIMSSMTKNRRIPYLLGMMCFSELSLLGFAVFPPALKILAIFLSALPLGLTWGIMFSYIEGRRISEVLNVGISIALILSSGLVKTLGQYVMDVFGITEYWMPFTTGVVIIPVLLLFTYLLSQIPEPTAKDLQTRCKREPMNRQERNAFLHNYLGGIIMLVLLFSSLTVFRELRDSFAADFWREVGVTNALIFTQTELPIALLVLGLMFLTVFVHNNRKALNLFYAFSMVGGFLMISSTLLYSYGYLSPVWWMVISGTGMYLGYTTWSFLIERLIASLRITSTIIFLLYLGDSFGYLGTASVFMVKNFATIHISWNTMLTYAAAVSGVITMYTVYAAYRYFKKQFNTLDLTYDEEI